MKMRSIRNQSPFPAAYHPNTWWVGILPLAHTPYYSRPQPPYKWQPPCCDALSTRIGREQEVSNPSCKCTTALSVWIGHNHHRAPPGDTVGCVLDLARPGAHVQAPMGRTGQHWLLGRGREQMAGVSIVEGGEVAGRSTMRELRL